MKRKIQMFCVCSEHGNSLNSSYDNVDLWNWDTLNLLKLPCCFPKCYSPEIYVAPTEENSYSDGRR